MPADAVETIAMRAASLRSLLGDAMAATQLSAAWVWGAIDEPPARHSAHRAVERRLHHVIARRLVLHDVYLPVEARVCVERVWVSTPPQTLLDLARAWVDAPAEASMLRAMRAMVTRELARTSDAIALLADRPRVPGKTAVIQTLQALEAEFGAL